MAYRLLGLAVQREYGLFPLPEIRRSERGKPFFPDYPGLCFNLSHSRGAVVCALHDGPVGIDVERLRPAPRRLGAGRSDREFFLAWTEGEAVIKRDGLDWRALLTGMPADERCRHLPELLPGWMVAVCPMKNGPIRCVRIEPEELER